MLRPCRDEDLPVIYRVFAVLASWPVRSARPPEPLTYAVFREWYSSATGLAGGVAFVIEVDGDPAGRYGMFDEDPFPHFAELGIALLPEGRGQGYNTDALRVLIGFVFRAQPSAPAPGDPRHERCGHRGVPQGRFRAGGRAAPARLR